MTAELPVDGVSTEAPRVAPPAFMVVGVGASAGGMEAFAELLRDIPRDAPLAFVLIQHLDPTHPSLLTEVLSRGTNLPVQQITDGVKVEPGQVYVIPPNADAEMAGGALNLLPREVAPRASYRPINRFFRSLAADQGGAAAGVVLSGSGEDGAEGLRAIKTHDGVTLVQDPRSARFSGMPDAAARAGVADLILPIPALADELLRLARRLDGSRSPEPDLLAGPDSDRDLEQVLALLRAKEGADFKDYKVSTVRRRLSRRLGLRRKANLNEYLDLLRSDPDEARALLEDLLIHVTAFFRDRAALERLQEVAVPAILDGREEGQPIRVWVAGCSTGEEVYSIAIALLESLEARGLSGKFPLQLFGSDISDLAIEKARAARYPDAIAQNVKPAQLAKFFNKLEVGYCIDPSVRDLCAFVRHDLSRDPPFSKLDIVSSRNVLIYFNQALQKRVLSTFHFALRQPGFLCLGRSENLAESGQLFTVVDREHRIFARKPGKSTLHLERTHDVVSGAGKVKSPGATLGPPDIVRRAESLLLDRYAPPGVIVNDRLEILHFLGRTAPYLEPAPGRPANELLMMARGSLARDLRIAIAQARKQKSAVKRTGVPVGTEVDTCDLVVMPFDAGDHGEPMFSVLFEGTRREGSDRAASGGPEEVKLETALEATEDYLQSLIEDHQSTSNRLSTANEELLSSNEELQSLNEELETAKEELQATNEELTTLNEELQNRNTELARVNSDVLNILASVEVPILIVDAQRHVRQFTPKARPILNLLPSDVGRPISDLKPNIDVPDLDRRIADVMEQGRMLESEVRDQAGRWHRLQIRPYLSLDRQIEGAVLSIVDIDALKRAVGVAEWARDFATATVETVQTPLLVLDKGLRVVSANAAYYECFAAARSATEGKDLFSLLDGAWDASELRAALESTVGENSHFQKLELRRRLPPGSSRALTFSARPLRPPAPGPAAILLSIEDVTDQKEAEEERTRLLAETESAKAAAEQANRTKDLFLATLSHELRTPLSALLLQGELLRRGGIDAARLERIAAGVQRAARVQSRLIEDLLDSSRIVTGKLRVDRVPVNLAQVARAAVESARPAAETHAIQLAAELESGPHWVAGDPARLQQVLANILANAIKFTPAGGRVSVRLDAEESRARVRVVDTGLGIEPAFLPCIFDRFTQENRSTTRPHGGLGLGLAIAKHLVDRHGGTISAESPGKGLGSTFTLTLPLLRQGSAFALEPAGEADSAPLDLGGARVLLVDDDSESREALLEVLSMSGADARAAGSVQEAVKLFEQQPSEILVCDIAMPDEDGYSLLRRIRALPLERGGGVPAVALTALAGEADRAEALARGFAVHLAKPVAVDRLVQTLREVIGQREAPVAKPSSPEGPAPTV